MAATLEKKQRKRRVRSSHPGVVLRKREWKSGVTTWFARWTDPDTGRVVDTNLTKLGKTSAEARVDWAKRKCKSLRERRAAIEAGAPLRSSTPPKDAVKAFLRDREHQVRQRTIETYQESLDEFLEWTQTNGVNEVEQLGPRHLMQLSANLAGKRKQVQAAKGRRGKRKPTKQRRSAATINRHLRVIHALLQYCRKIYGTPLLTSDDISDNLRKLKRDQRPPRFLQLEDIGKLVDAALAHDAAKFKLTRAEKDGDGKPGESRRYVQMAPFVVAALLTGARFSELAKLKWENVGLDTGFITIVGADAKSGVLRRIPLDVTPKLVALLEVMNDNSNGSYVFGGAAALSRDLAETARKRLRRAFGAPTFSWHDLRRTCGTVLACSDVYAGSSAYLAAKRLGHSVDVSERHYLGAVRPVPDATSIEDAMALGDKVAHLIDTLERRSVSDGEED